MKKKNTISERHSVAGLVALVIAFLTVNYMNAMTIGQYGGWLETAFVTWQPVDNAVCYKVSYSGEGISGQEIATPLIRKYPEYMRADIPGLKAGVYTVTVKALDSTGKEIDTAVTPAMSVSPNNREGFAFSGGNVPGAYTMDGTPKEGARVLYVSAETVNSITCDVADSKGKLASYTGLANILSAYGKGYDKTPLIIRVIGAVKAEDFEGLKDGNYINLQGSNNSSRLIENITLEGIGTDATLYGYGICFKRAHNIEIRNVGIMLFGDDAISMDTDNTNIWLHNIDFFYGKPGRDADQVKGDGSIDMKYNSSQITISYNHFWDSGKVMGCGGTTGEKQTLMISFHHNWFDHTDSRCPRLHYTTAHIYNNYYDGVSVYGIGNTTESSAFVEGNYFRNVKRPMMISGQGTDSYDEKTGTYTLKGTFSGQDGGMTKAYDNIFAENTPKLVYQTDHATQFDAYLVGSRDERVPETVTSVKGNWAYSNFDTAETMYESLPDAPADVPEKVTAYAGRMDGGDLKWSFDNSVDDDNHDVNTALKEAITSYQGRLVAIQGEGGFATGISTQWASDAENAVFHDLNGRRMTDAASGVNIVRKGGNVTKVVRK